MRGGEKRWRDCHCTALTGADAEEETGVSQKDNEKCQYFSHCWAESISKGFKKCSSFILCQEPFLFSKERKWITLNTFHGTFFLPIKSQTAIETSCVLSKYNRGPPSLFHYSCSLIQYRIAGPWRQMSLHQHADVVFLHLGSVIIETYNAVEVKDLRGSLSPPGLFYSVFSTFAVCPKREFSTFRLLR